MLSNTDITHSFLHVI